MIPVFAIVGRPNVGKSTLFNMLTRSRQALVLDEPGITRDRIYGEGKYLDQSFIVIDTGGLTETESSLAASIRAQTEQAIEESEIIFFVVDGQVGLQPEDYNIAKRLRQSKRPVLTLVNKTEGQNPDIAVSEFFALGLGDPLAISASHGAGLSNVLEFAFSKISEAQTQILESALENKTAGIHLAIVGRPNVGKSTLVNRLLGENRVLVLDEPGTTRDSIYIPLERDGTIYTLIDTAGVRKRGRIVLKVEKFSVIKTLQSIEASQVVILVIDAKEGLTDQDLSLLDFILEAGKGIVIAVNKWDGLTVHQKKQIKAALNYRLKFADFAEILYISALHGTNVGHLFEAVQATHLSATKELSTAVLSRVLAKAQTDHPPPMIRGRRIKLRYAHAGGQSPPLIVIHGNQTEQVPASYKRYLMGYFRKAFKLVGTPIRLEFKTAKNPYATRRNKLTPRQLHKSKRLKSKTQIKSKMRIKSKTRNKQIKPRKKKPRNHS